jgi:hypothetical protein
MLEYDFFISYSHAAYTLDALELSMHMLRYGKVWLDKQQLPPILPDMEVAYALSEAVQSSKYLIFFDLRGWLLRMAQLVTGQVIPTENLGSLATKWQKFERAFGERIVDLYPPLHRIEFGGPMNNLLIREPKHLLYYTDYEDAAAKIAGTLGYK